MFMLLVQIRGRLFLSYQNIEQLKSFNMKNVHLKKLFLAIIGCLTLAVFTTSCKKDGSNPNNEVDKGIHHINPQFVGKWLWTEGSDEIHYDDNGVYQGAAYGLATQFNISADGNGTCFNHVYSTIGEGTYLEVNISYKGFFESDDEGHLGFFPTSGTYKSTSGENRALRSDELWNTQKGTGVSFLYQKVNFTSQGGRSSFQTTASNGTVDTYFKVQ
jgi:hypothetical protein